MEMTLVDVLIVAVQLIQRDFHAQITPRVTEMFQQKSE